MSEITIRFVTCDDPISILIRVQAGICMPFTPSHTEALSRDGTGWTGQHIDGGCLKRPLDYYLKYPNPRECQVKIPVTDEQFDAFHSYLEAHIGSPYDWRAIEGFGLTELNAHMPGGQICSALMHMCARAGKIFPFPVITPAHHISPRDHMLMLSAIVEIDH